MVNRSLDSRNMLHIQSVGGARLISDRRQLAAILLVLGICATIEPLVDISIFVGKEDFKAAEPIRIASFAASLVQVVFGCLAVAVGFLHLVMDYGNSALSGALVVAVQGAWAPFVIRLYELIEQTVRSYEVQIFQSLSGDGTTAKEEYVSNPFIPDELVPTIRDVRIVGSTGIAGELTYMLAFYGALSFCAFAIDTFDRYKPTARDGKFYRGRHLVYSFVLAAAGLSQLLLGAYILFGFGSGPLQHAITVAMYTVYYPEMTIAMGGLQMLIGYFGIARYLDCVTASTDNHQFQAAILLQWLSMLAVQYLTQIGLSYEDEYPRGLPDMVLLSIGLSLFPAFLDYKMRTTPFTIPESFYDLHKDPKSFPPDMQGIANRGLILHHMPDDEEMANPMPAPEETNLIQRSNLDTFEDEYMGDDNDESEDHLNPNHTDNASQGRSLGSDSVDPPTDENAENETEDDESEQPFDSDSDPVIPSRRSSQMHPLASAGFFGEEVNELEHSLLEETNLPSEEEHGETKLDETYPPLEDEHGEAMESSDDDMIDALFREKATQRSSDATQMVSNRKNEFESSPDDSSDNGSDVEYNHNRRPNRDRSLSRDPPGVTKSKSYSSHDENSDTADDDTDALDEKLQEIERELYTDSMEQFRQSLVHIL